MSMLEELQNKSKEELDAILTKNFEEAKYEHDMYARMGAVGVSPRHMQMFSDSMKKFKEINSSDKERL